MIVQYLLALGVMAATVESRGDLLDKFTPTPEELILIQQLAQENLEAEENQTIEFVKSGIDRLDPLSTLGQHLKFTFTSQRSVVEDVDNRINVLQVLAGIQVLKVPPELVLPLVNLGFGPKLNICEIVRCCDEDSPYRTANGSCNNLKNVHWGESFTPLRRYIDPDYEDDVSEPRGGSPSSASYLPSPRLVSTTIHQHSDNSHLHDIYTHMLMQWGQFLDHDITSTAVQQSSGYPSPVACCLDFLPFPTSFTQADLDARPECFAIPVPPGDPHFTISCLNFVRSVQVPNAKCHPAPVEQQNQITAYIDGSQIYGSSQDEQDSLRTFDCGKLKEGNVDHLVKGDPLSCNTPIPDPPHHCFKAGDERVNENPTLQSIHTLFLREHNRIADELKARNCHWDDEKLFQETRKIVGAILQVITYKEYLPILLGPAMATYELEIGVNGSGYSHCYDCDLDASIKNAFATAAFRIGHTMIRAMLGSYDNTVACNHLGDDTLSDVYGNTAQILSTVNRNVDNYCRGLVKDEVQGSDRFMTSQVTDHLFPSGGLSLDLAALNIQRGRDHGLPGYTAFREYCGLSPDLADIPMAVAGQLMSLYSSDMSQIDLFTGGISESLLPGAMVGPLFACLLGEQFRALKKGDRFWIEEDNDHVKFTLAQVESLREASLSRVICDNTNTSAIQPNAFLQDPDGTAKEQCADLPQIDLDLWTEATGTWLPWGPWGDCDETKKLETRTRTCDPCDGRCVGVNADCRVCATSCDGTCKPWSPWGKCNGFNQKTRTRYCPCPTSETVSCKVKG